MFTKKAQAMGGKIMAKRQRDTALVTYYETPNYCKNCGSRIDVRSNEQVKDARKRKFCNKSCAITFNNKSRERKISSCSVCGIIISNKTKTGRCRRCARLATRLYNRTKGELFKERSGYQSARSSIRRHADIVYTNSGKPRVCAICGYDKHIDVAHIKPVSSFPDDVLWITINEIDNLIALCPNHHWEFDHELLRL